MEDKSPFIWDKYSDQPYPIKDKEYKKQKRKDNLFDYIPLIFYNIFIFPLSILLASVFKGKKVTADKFFGMCVNLNKGEKQVELIDELGVDEVQIRVPLAKIENLEDYVAFAKKFKERNKNVLITILQDREYIDDLDKFEYALTKIFKRFHGVCDTFVIGNAINRTKWGFFSVGEYLEFYKVAYNLRNEGFQHIKLVGPSIIDFEFHYTIRALFNKYFIKYDKNSSLLYVDRRGAPEKTQMGFFDTTKKIDFLYSLCSLSARTSNEILVTETNWPISNTAPWAPTSEKECVSEDEYTNYMLRYYFLCLGSKKIQTVYWHQLIAPGYGLIDTRKGFRKRESFEAYKFMIKMIKDSRVFNFTRSSDLHVLTCKNKTNTFDVIWSSSNREIDLEESYIIYDKLGKKLEGTIKITQSPIYAIHRKGK